ncbi:MAG TPA: hypothetical protein PKC67_14310 [Kiritimatiellia bacterium]|nr:hypothetical protein [Kiritimatiellia bacterium]HMP35509.1 hypothetical protein [Kiritimatiellia bacterium]
MTTLELNRNLGTQPLDAIMEGRGLTNHALVAASDEGITHKMVQRARKGRMLTRNAQEKVLRALNRAVPEQAFERQELFTYPGC